MKAIVLVSCNNSISMLSNVRMDMTREELNQVNRNNWLRIAYKKIQIVQIKPIHVREPITHVAFYLFIDKLCIMCKKTAPPTLQLRAINNCPTLLETEKKPTDRATNTG